MFVPGLTYEENMIAFAFNNLASRESDERQALGRHFERLLFPTPTERSYMWTQGNHLHVYAGVTAFYRENLSLTMIRIRLGLVQNIVMYDPVHTELTVLEYLHRRELLCYFVPRSIHMNVELYRGMRTARQYRLGMRRRLGN